MEPTEIAQDRGSSRRPPTRPIRRLGWFVLLWLASVAFLGMVAYVIRLWLGLG